MIDIEEVPEIAKTFIVKNGVVNTSQKVNKKWEISNNVRRLSVESRGWLSDVLSIVDKQPEEFSLIDLYKYGSFLKTVV